MSFVRNGRIQVYPAEVLVNTDLLRQEFFRMVDVSNLAQAILGVGSTPAALAFGLACTPVASTLTAQIGQGVIWSFVAADTNAYPVDNSGLNADTIDNLYKPFTAIGAPITGMFDPTTMTAGTGGNSYVITETLTPATTPGDSIAYLIEAAPTTLDTEANARQYYNNNNPAQPVTNSFNDVRVDFPYFKVKASAQANPPVIPTPDAGYVGLWVVTVPQGATQITSGMIAPYSGAPFIPYTLTQMLAIPALQNSIPIYALDTGTANAYVFVGNPVYGAAQAGTQVRLKAANSNTGASTLNATTDGAIAIQVQHPTGLIACVGGEIIAGEVYDFVYNGTVWELINPSTLRALYGIESMSATQTIAGANTNALVEWNDSPQDPFSMWSGSPNYKWTVPIAGLYSINAGLFFQNNSNSGSLILHVYKNGSLYRRLVEVDQQSGDDSMLSGTLTLTCAAGDYIQIYAQNGTSANINVGTNSQFSYFNITYLGLG